MTWQRIDENTYIDDTLVTCAEYQLFIDEMREQGEYYQPDHWTSYQFPAGEAREPVRGVRHSDAVAFCNWLTNRKGGEWMFRLPTQKELIDYPVMPYLLSPLGVWNKSTDDQPQFSWLVPATSNARCIFLNLNLTLEIDHILDQALIRANGRGIDIEHSLSWVLNYTRKFVFPRKRDFVSIFSRALSVDRNLAHDRAIAFDLARARALDLGKLLIDERKIAQELELAIDLFIDILTLQERIAGRSRAFEGIRLVKERI
jgi:hypothetical protein